MGPTSTHPTVHNDPIRVCGDCLADHLHSGRPIHHASDANPLLLHFVFGWVHFAPCDDPKSCTNRWDLPCVGGILPGSHPGCHLGHVHPLRIHETVNNLGNVPAAYLMLQHFGDQDLRQATTVLQRPWHSARFADTGGGVRYVEMVDDVEGEQAEGCFKRGVRW